MLPRNGNKDGVQCDEEGLGVEEHRADRRQPVVVYTVVHQNVSHVICQKHQEERRRL
jgi:hypothetical protein